MKQAPSNDFEQIKGLASPARRALAGAGITRLAQLSEKTEAELLQLHGMGPKAMGALRAALQAQGMSFQAGTD
ncbi:DNA-binding protein [Paenibacillus whitsoniae]|uniref:DNA-binding protein n=1 Tax=Paenibacillus whitsoniae TaxID=2496558 RepID=A0A3S0BW93_9BACL|nr:DNA-binding protein [Paenibacillus whitsoniae]RTE09783.1 DNA-binding protein [Paenibacillus whitsoniae]